MTIDDHNEQRATRWIMPLLGTGVVCIVKVMLEPFTAFSGVVLPAIVVWLLCWCLGLRRIVIAEKAPIATAHVTGSIVLAAILAIESQFQLIIESALCGPYACGGRFFAVPGDGPLFAGWRFSLFGFLPEPSLEVAAVLRYAPLAISALVACGSLRVFTRSRLPWSRAVAISVFAAVAVAYGTPSYAYLGWSHWPTPNLSLWDAAYELSK